MSLIINAIKNILNRVYLIRSVEESDIFQKIVQKMLYI